MFHTSAPPFANRRRLRCVGIANNSLRHRRLGCIGVHRGFRHAYLRDDDGHSFRLVRTICARGIELTIAAGLAWAIPLPALYILNSLTGSRLRASTTLLAALVTTSWGGLALVASIPINWFFSVAVPSLPTDLIGASAGHWIVRLVNLLVFLGVGVSMVDVFGRVMNALEPDMGRYPTWFLILVGAIGAQLAFLFNLFPPA